MAARSSEVRWMWAAVELEGIESYTGKVESRRKAFGRRSRTRGSRRKQLWTMPVNGAGASAVFVSRA